MTVVDRPYGLLGTGIYHGQKKPGVEKAYNQLVQAGLYQLFTDNNLPYKDYGDMADNPGGLESYQSLYDKTLEILNNDHYPCLIGGDHSQSFATVSALLQKYPDLHIVWIDAHGDINTPETSPSGNLHGMPLAGLLGMVDKEYWRMPFLSQDLQSHNVALLGVRDLDDGELAIIDQYNMLHYSTHELRVQGIRNAIAEIKKDWGDPPVHLSFDIDGMDSKLVPATGTPVGDGINEKEMKEIVAEVKKEFNVVSFEVVEFNPDLAVIPEALATTTKTVMSILKTFLL